LRMVADLVEQPPAATAYDDIKNRLVASHQLTDFQKAEKLFQMPALGSRKPSDLMAAMLETCPRGEEKSNLFACIFLQRLPREIRVLLANVDHKDPKALATRADELWSLHDNPVPLPPLQSPWCSRRDRRWIFVTAVRPGGQRGGNSRGGARGRSRGRGDRRLLRRPGWPSAFASNTGGTETRPHPAHSPAAGRETAAPGATERGRSRRTLAPGGRVIRSAVSGRHRRFLQHFSPPVFTAGLRPRLEGAWRSDHRVLGREAVAGAVLRPPFYLDFSISKSRISNSWCRFFKTF
jgi:hypothetical protein